MNDVIYQNFKTYYPMIEKHVLEYRIKSPFELVVRLDDRSLILYDDVDHSFINYRDDDSRDDQYYILELSNRLRQIMRLKGVTQSQLSELTGIAQSIISNYITGRVSPSYLNVLKITRVLDCSIDDLRYPDVDI